MRGTFIKVYTGLKLTVGNKARSLEETVRRRRPSCDTSVSNICQDVKNFTKKLKKQPLRYHHTKNNILQSVLQIRIRDPVPVRPLNPGWVKNQDPDPG